MAQCGMFVPANNCSISPFETLFTRISGSDNMFRGLSSYAVELVELATIFKRSNKKSMIIGDEICRGTDSRSADIVVTSSIMKLMNQEARFIFATHLHSIQKHETIINTPKLVSKHLSVIYDKQNDKLIFDRIMKDGPGDDFYGVVIAKYIIKDQEFIDNLMIYSDASKNMLNGKISNYNSDKTSEVCEICKKRTDILHTHHIIYQQHFGNSNFSNVEKSKHISKNQKSNLVMICQPCHIKIHNNEITIDNPIVTSNGIDYNLKTIHI
jgi:DNA mismatch repair protein MutS